MLTFLFTDIEGSTRLWERHWAAMGSVIARHDAILRDHIRACEGRITKHTGDGVTAAFEAGDPLACALEMQKTFAAEAWGAIGELRVRVGLHAGDAEWLAGPEADGGDYYGPPVNCTARIMSAAWGGQILLTPQVMEISALPPQATALDLGEHLLKDVSAPQQIYQLLHPDLPRTEFPPPRSLSGQAISQTVGQQGQRLAGLQPEALVVGLVSATLLPAVLGDLPPQSPALAGNVGVLHDLGAVILAEFLARFAARPREGQPEEIRRQLEIELRQLWDGEGLTALALRTEASRLLKAVHGVEATMMAATAEVKAALAQGLADLGGTFDEFRWMASQLQETLAEVRMRQALQLALQREQLDLQRQQLVKTNLILQRQQAALAVPPDKMSADETGYMATDLLPPADGPCPYKGLAAFEAEDADCFFGREELVAELTARLAGNRFLAVVGPSGSGKSSVVRAGLLPAIWRDALPGSKAWPTLVLTPGAHPLEELAVRVSLLQGIEASALLQALQTRPQALHLAVKQALADGPEGAELLLVVDQFEEIFALCRNAMERRAFIDALLYAVEAEGGRLVVVPTIRADFYGRCADYPELAARMSDGVLVGPMSEAELREAIVRPAELVGLRLEPGLAQTVIADVSDEPGALPLLSHALLETWGRRRGRMLTLSGYAASGGVAGAIAQTADSVFGQFSPDEQAIARNVFLRLTELGEEGTQDTRRRVAPAELARAPEEEPATASVLKILADARLVTTGEDSVEVAHEALIREWGRLREWLDASRDDLRAHRRLTAAAAEWVDAGRDDGFLLRGSRLGQFETWASETGPSLSQVERDYIEASVAARTQREAEREQERAARARAEEQARRSRQLRRLAMGLAAVLLLAIVAGVFALIQRNESQRLLRLSVSHRLTAASINSLETYPERSILLALEAMTATYAKDNTVTREADAALRRALEALHLQLTIFGHGGPVYGVAVSPDGACLATAGADRTARVWDATSGEELYTLSGHTSLVRAVAFGPAGAGAGRCGATLATAGDDGTARVWSLASSASAPPEELLTLSGHGARVSSVAFNANGTRLATASEDGTVKIWDAATGQELLTLSGHAGPVHGVGFSPDGTRLATAGEDGTAREWSLASSAGSSGEELLTLSGHVGPVYAVTFSLDGTHLATAGGDGTARVWDATSGEELITLSGHSGAVRGVAFGPDGTRLATSSDDETAKVWSLGSTVDSLAELTPGGDEGPRTSAYGQELLTLVGHTAPVHAVAFSPDGVRLATASEDRTARVWNISASQGWLSLSGHTEAIWFAAFSPDGTRLATAGTDGTAQVWDAASGQELLTLSGHTDEVNVIAFDPDGTHLATASLDGTARVWDAASGRELLTLIGHSGWVMGVTFSPDGKRLATAGTDGTAQVWDAASGQQLLTLAGHNGWLTRVAFSPDGTRLAMASQDGTASVWDAASGRELRTLSGQTGGVFGIAFSPDGTRLATANEDGTAKIWDATSGQELLTLSGHSDWVLDVAFGPSGTSLATASADGTARLWDAAAGDELLSLPSDADMVTSVAFSPDGTRLATAGTGGMVRIYVLDVEELMALACRRITRNLTEAEWQTYLGQDVAYRRTCPNLPVPPAWLTYGHVN